MTARRLRWVALAVALAAVAGLAACGGGGGGEPGATPPPPPPASSNRALRFFGTGTGDIDRVKIALSASTRANLGATDFTLEFWIKGNASSNTPAAGCSTAVKGWTYGNIVIDRDIYNSGEYGDYGISLFDGRVGFGISNSTGAGPTICGAASVLDGAWHHVAVTRRFADGRMQLFVDGALDAQFAGNAGTSQDIAYRVGRATAYPNSDPFLVFGAKKHDAGVSYPSFNGWLDEVEQRDPSRGGRADQG